MYPMESFRGISGWPRSVGTSQVSCFVVLSHFVVDALGLEVYRFNIDPITLPSPSTESNDSIRTFWIVSGWLCDAGAFQVSVLDVWRSTDVCRFEFHMATLPPRSIDLQATLWGVSAWLHNLGMSQVSRFVPLRYFVIHTLNLGLHRFNLDAATSTAGPMGPIATFQGISAWFRHTGTHPVGRFDFMRLADFSRYGFDSSASMAEPDESVRTFCGTCGWHGRHW